MNQPTEKRGGNEKGGGGCNGGWVKLQVGGELSARETSLKPAAHLTATGHRLRYARAPLASTEALHHLRPAGSQGPSQLPKLPELSKISELRGASHKNTDTLTRKGPLGLVPCLGLVP